MSVAIIQLVRGMMRGQISAGHRAAVIALALVLAMITPWVLTICIVASALLVALHLLDTRGIPGHHVP